MNQGTQGYRLTKETEGRKSRETVPLNVNSDAEPEPNHFVEAGAAIRTDF
jgi:hypothetical protein